MSDEVQSVRIRCNFDATRYKLVMQVKSGRKDAIQKRREIVRRDTGRKSKRIKEAWKAT